MPELTSQQAQYNSAGEELQRAIARHASENTVETLTALTDAQSEFTRCDGNLRAIEGAQGELQRFTPVTNDHVVGMDERDLSNYSMLRGIQAQITGNWRDASLEREISDAIAERTGRPAQGFYVPLDVQMDKRTALTSGQATTAGNLIATNMLAESFIDILRNRMSVTQAGATFLSGLTGNVAIPRQSGAGTFAWVTASDNSAVGVTNQTVDQVTMTPKAGGAYTDIGRTLLLQSSVDVENMVRNDLARIIALGIDSAALRGTGSAPAPKGVRYATSTNLTAAVGGTNGGAPTWANIVALETAVAASNADLGTIGYIVNAKGRGYLKSTPKVATYSATMMWDNSSPDAPLNGYKAVVSNQIPSDLTKGSGTGLSEIYFGNWADCIIGQWGGLDILVDPYTGGTAGTVRLIAIQDVDCAVRHGESFACMVDAAV